MNKDHKKIFEDLSVMEKKIIRLDKHYIYKGGEILGRALCDDPVSVQVLPDGEVRKAKIKHVFQMTMCYGVRWGEVYATSPNLEGVAIWIPFEKYHEKMLRLLRCAFKGKGYKLGMGAQKRFKPINKCNEAVHKEFAPGEHWYLQTLGVDPIHQGKGYGSALMRHMLKKIDQQDLPVFLETSTVKNVKFYEKLGFKIAKEVIIPKTQVKEWFMLRD